MLMPIAIDKERAAEFLSLSITTLEKLQQRGDFPKPRQLSDRRVAYLVSELGELADAIIKRDKAGIIDGIGDVLVTLIVVAALEDLDVKDCLASAYAEIKDRKGTLLPNGTFVKAT